MITFILLEEITLKRNNLPYKFNAPGTGHVLNYVKLS